MQTTQELLTEVGCEQFTVESPFAARGGWVS